MARLSPLAFGLAITITILATVSQALRVGIIGAGRIAKVHADNINNSKYAEVAWVVCPRSDRGAMFAHEHDCDFYTSWDDAMNKEDYVDAYIIATPSETHFDYIKMLAPSKIPIFCEKPVSIDTAVAMACQDVIEKHKTPFFLGFNRRFDDSFASLKMRADAGEVGAVQRVYTTSRDPAVPPLPYLLGSGGIYHDSAVHDFDLAYWLLGEDVTEVYAEGSNLVVPGLGLCHGLADHETIDTSCCVLRTSSGKTAVIKNSRRALYGYDQRVEVHGNEGMLRCDNIGPTNVQSSTAAGIRHDPPYKGMDRYTQAYRDEMRSFLADTVRDGLPPKVCMQDGLRANLIADAAVKSFNSGHSERVQAM